MTVILANSNLDLKKDRLLALLLVCSAFFVALVGWYPPYQTGLYIASCELVFVMTFFLFNQTIDALNFLFKNKLLLWLSILWYFFFNASYIQLFFQNASSFQIYIATLSYLFTSMHLIFFLCIISFFAKSKYSNGLSLNPVALSNLIIVYIFYLIINSGIVIPESFLLHSPPFASNIRYIGYLFTIGSLTSVLWLLTKQFNDRFFILYGFIALVNLSFLVWLGGRTAIASVYISLFFLLFYLRKYKELNYKKIFFLTGLIITSLIIAYQTSIYSWNGMGWFISHLGVDGEFDVNRFSSNRLAIWSVSINAIKESPWLGFGPNGYYFIQGHFFGLHPHNMVLQFFLDWGVIGGVIFLLILLYSILKGVILLVTTNNSSLALALLIISGLTLHGLTDGTYYHAQPVFYLLLAFALIPASLLKEQHAFALK
ncbi:MAG: O-antigen ligase [Psychromonas sp.]|jgi:O-antigen ligase|uniref:O-antigen ligase family protein n=1 Tax=Psychromonas sp. TaxID=1884585 RepID=UPI0039E4FD47